MNKNVIRFSCLLFLSLCFACNQRNKEANKIFTQVDNIVEEYPDSALTLLKSIDFPEDLNEANYANYLLLYVQAKDKSGMSIKGDTLIQIPVNYFSHHSKQNDRKTALAYFYSSRVFRQQSNLEKAIQQILLAEDYAEKLGDNNLLGLIYFDLGILYDKQVNDDLALQNYKKSRDYFLKAGNKKNANYILRFIGDVFLQMIPQQTDSAFYYYDSAILYAEFQSDVTQLSIALKNKAVAYKEIDNYEKAKELLYRSLSLDKHGEQAAANYIILSKIYLSLNVPDSAIYYANASYHEIQGDNDFNRLYNYYELMSSIYASIFNYKQALEYAQKSVKSLDLSYENAIEQSILDIQEKYLSEKWKTDLQKTKLGQQFLVIVILSVILISCLFVYSLIAKIKKNREKIRQVEQNLEVMSEMLDEYNENKNSLQRILLEQLDLAKKVAKISTMSNKVGGTLMDNYLAIFGQNIGDKLDWTNLYPVIDGLYNGFARKVRKQFPDLSEKETQLCCLFRAEFKIEEITIIQGYENIYSAHAQKDKLRRKLGCSGMKEFIDFLKKL